MSNHKSYGRQRGRPGNPASPWSTLSVCTGERPRDEVYDRLGEIADSFVRKGYSEDYALEKASELLSKREVI